MAKVITNGTEADDVLISGADSNGYAVFGFAGSDYIVGSPSDDELDGGDGLDGVSYADATANITVDLATGTASGDGIGNDTLTSIEAVDGGSGSDTLTANDSGSILYGMGGHDVLIGGLGADALYGGTGNDDLRGGGDDIGNTLYGN